jgi:hypothetical protein
MDSLVLNALLNKSGAERAALIGRARNYIHNDMFINLLNQINVNDKTGGHIRLLARQFAMFNAVPNLRDEVQAWATS